jgi:hypothetical protein
MKSRDDLLIAEHQCRVLADGARPEAKQILEKMAEEFHGRADGLAPAKITPASLRLILGGAAVSLLMLCFLAARWLK